MAKANTTDSQHSAMLEKAARDFLNGDKKTMASSAGAVYYEDTDTIETIFIGRPYIVRCADASISPKGHGAKLTGFEPAMILLNLSVATGRPLSGKLLTYRELFKDGRSPLSAMQASSNEFARIFGSRPDKLYKVLDRFPGERCEYGDAAIKINLLPRLPVVFAVWEGEGAAIPPSSTILYDSSAGDYLPHDALNVFPASVLDKFNEFGAGLD